MLSAIRRMTRGKGTALLGIGCAAGGLLLVSGLLLDSWRRVELTSSDATLSGSHAEDVLVWMAYLSLWVALMLILVRAKGPLRSKWVGASSVIALAAETLVHMADSRSFGLFPPKIVILLKVIGAVSAALTALGLPVFLHAIQNLERRAENGDLSETRLAVAMERSLDAVLIFRSVRDAADQVVDFRFTFVNVNAEQMLGVERVYLLEKNLGELYPAIATAGRIDQFKAVVDLGQTFTLETESPILRSGTLPAYCRLHAMKLGDGLVVTCTDLTHSKLADRDLKRALAFNKAVVLSSPFSIIVTDLEGKITAVNPAAERLLLYSKEDLRGQNIMLLHIEPEIQKRASELSREFGVPIQPDFSVLRTKVNLGTSEEREWTYLRKDGSEVPVQLTTSVVEDEEGAVIGVMNVSHDLTERKQSNDYIYQLAHYDTLTGLPVRSLLHDRLEMAIVRGGGAQTLFAVMLIDLDHFKRVNDLLGHQAGDSVLCAIAERLKKLVREVDTVARFGGDQFIVLLSELRSRRYAERLAQKVMDILSAPIRVQGENVEITVSVGLSFFSSTSTADELIRQADIAMYRSKSLGGNGVVTFTPNLGQEVMHKLLMETEMRAGLARNEFSLLYQPQVLMSTSALTGVEALIRWNNPTLGTVMPNDFIPIAEETGLIVAIGAWAIRTACMEIAQLQRESGNDLTLAVNVSPRQVHEEDFQRTIEHALAESGLDPALLEIEITERLLMRDSEEALQIIERIQALGVTTAIDDFGTGFSNMSYITRFKVDRLKIDRTFVSRCVEDENSLAVTTAIIELAHSLKMTVVAEGVETAEQALKLYSLQCDAAQGYLYSRPLSLANLRQYTETAEAERYGLTPV